MNQALGAAQPTAAPDAFADRRTILTFGFHYHESDQTLTNAYPSVGGQTITHGYDVPIGYVRSFGRLINTFRVEYNLSTIDTQNLYANNTNVTGLLGINWSFTESGQLGPAQSFLHQLRKPSGHRSRSPIAIRRVSFTDQMIYTHKKHTLRWGGDFRRLEINSRTASNPRGSFVFTGLNTSADC